MGVTVVDHPLVQHKLTQLRRKETPSESFRGTLREIAMLLAYEALHDLPLEKVEIETPLTRMMAPQLAGKRVCFVSILRAGNGLLDGMLDVLPSARVGHVGLYRDPRTLSAVEYYCKLPTDIAQREAVVLDPMLATGHSAVAAVTRVKELGARAVRYVCLLAAPEGVAELTREHPDVPIVTAAIDERLNDHGYIVPGLGDAGDRIYGTK
jgi:uracil phosphoribosyltransferase